MLDLYLRHLQAWPRRLPLQVSSFDIGRLHNVVPTKYNHDLLEIVPSNDIIIPITKFHLPLLLEKRLLSIMASLPNDRPMEAAITGNARKLLSRIKCTITAITHIQVEFNPENTMTKRRD